MAQVAVQTQLRPLIPGFLARIRSDIALCKVAVTAGHHSKLRALCHKNSGSCAMYGFTRLGELFAAIEHVSLADAPPRRMPQRQRGIIPPSNDQVLAAFTRLERYAQHMTITFQ